MEANQGGMERGSRVFEVLQGLALFVWIAKRFLKSSSTTPAIGTPL